MNILEFPGLWGLKFAINPVALSFGTINIYWYGIIIATGFMLAVVLGMRDSKNFDIDQESVIDLVLFVAPVAIICARLYYVAFKWEDYRDDLTEIYKIWHGGLAIYGGIIGGLLTAYFFAKYKKIPVMRLLDFGVPYLALAQSIGRWGNFINQEAYGTNTTLPWGMTSESIKNELYILQMQGIDIDPMIPVHPTFLYESLWNLGTFFLLLWFRKKKKFEGETFYLYMMIYGFGRFWIEGLRTDSLMLGSLRISQVLALIFALIFGILMAVKRKNAVQMEQRDVVVGASEYGAVLKQVRESEAQEESNSIPEKGDLPEADENPAESIEVQDVKSNIDTENDK